jgi:hypothetical protein
MYVEMHLERAGFRDEVNKNSESRNVILKAQSSQSLTNFVLDQTLSEFSMLIFVIFANSQGRSHFHSFRIFTTKGFGKISHLH